MVKTYAKWGGIILLVLGVIGFFVGDQLSVLNSETIEDIIHVVAGAILAYFGFRGTGAQARTWSYVFGVIFLLVGIYGFIDKSVLGFFKAGLGTVDNVVHLAYGVVGLWAGYTYKS